MRAVPPVEPNNFALLNDTYNENGVIMTGAVGISNVITLTHTCHIRDGAPRSVTAESFIAQQVREPRTLSYTHSGVVRGVIARNF
jgi:hypothetical protein